MAFFGASSSSVPRSGSSLSPHQNQYQGLVLVVLLVLWLISVGFIVWYGIEQRARHRSARANSDDADSVVVCGGQVRRPQGPVVALRLEGAADGGDSASSASSCTGTFSTTNPYVLQPCEGPCGNQTQVLAYLDTSGSPSCAPDVVTVSCQSGTCVCTREDLMASLASFAATVPYGVPPVECGGTCDQAVRGDTCQFGCPIATVASTVTAGLVTTVTYTMFGAPNVTCGSSGLWLLGSAGPSPASLPKPTAPTAPVCVPTNIVCPPVTPDLSCDLGLAGTSGTCVGAENGQTCQFTCRPGFSLPQDSSGTYYDTSLCAVGSDNVARWTRPVGCVAEHCAGPGLTGCGDCT